MPKKAAPKKPENRKSRAGRSIKTINFEKLHKQLCNVLHRETANLLTFSRARPLDKDESMALINYLKLTRELRKDARREEGEDISDEALERIAKKADK